MVPRRTLPTALASLLSLTLANSSPFLPHLSFTSPSPNILHTLATLLAVRPQTLFPNGHTIASVTIPAHTLIYHGRHDNDPAPSPEWLAFDIDMAYWIMGNMQDSRMLTYRSTRDIKAVYFDGASACLMGEGTWSQMVFLYNGTDDVPRRGGWGPPGGGGGHRGPPGGGDGDGKNPPWRPPPGQRPPGGRPPGGRPPGGRPPGDGPQWNPLQEEYFRARGLCQWLKESGLGGPGWGYEGIVRMNAGFEMIWCDFDSPSLKLISNLNVSAPRVQAISDSGGPSYEFQNPAFNTAQQRLRIAEDEGPHGPQMTDPSEPFRNSSGFLWFSATAKRYTGETRVRVDPSGVFSFYEPGLRNQTQTRSATDTQRFDLGENGEWKGKRSGSKGEERAKEIHDLLVRRRQHRLTTVDKNDGVFMREAVERRLRHTLDHTHSNRRIDWRYVAKEIITRYNEEMATLMYHLGRAPSSSHDAQMVERWLSVIRQYTHWFMLPFLEYPPDRPYAKDKLQELFGLESLLARKTLERCVTQYDTEEEPVDEEDMVFGEAVKETLHGMCSVVIKIGLEVEYHWFRSFDSGTSSPVVHHSEPYGHLLEDARAWVEDMEELVAWLGWAEQSADCRKPCGPGEVCYMPMWPVGGWGMGRPGEDNDSKYLWEPVCVGMEQYPPRSSGNSLRGPS